AVSMGLAFSSSNMLYYGWAHETQAAVIVLYFLERLTRTGKWADTGWLILALINLGGQSLVHVVAYYSIFIILYGLGRLLSAEKRVSLLKKLLFAGVASLLLSADYLWPTIFHYSNYFETSHREKYGWRQNISYSFFTFLFPHFYGHPLNEAPRWISGTFVNTAMFIGTAAFLAAVSGGLLRGVIKRDFHAVFYLATCLFGICFIYDLGFEKLERYVSLLPLLNLAPAIYFKAVLQLFVASLGALGLQYLWELRGDRRVVIACISFIIMLFVYEWGYEISRYIFSLIPKDSEYLSQHMPWAEGLALLSIALITLIPLLGEHKAARMVRAAVIAPLLLAGSAVETLQHWEGWVPYSKAESCHRKTAVTEFLQSKVRIGRIIGLGYAAVPSIINRETYGIEMAAGRMSVSAGYLELLRLADPGAYQSHPTQYLFSESTNLASPVWDLVNVRYIVAPRATDAGAIITAHPPYRLKAYRLSDGVVFERLPPPRHAYIHDRVQLFETPSALAEAIKSGFDVREVAAIEREEDLSPSVSPSENFDYRIRKIKRLKNRMLLDITVNGDAYLTLAEQYNPNWHAYADGRELRTYRSHFFLQGVQIPKGRYVLELRYRLKHLTLINILVALTLASTIAFIIYRSRRSE
ncbi:MAG: hypothetical protein J5J00_14390, partial [Deltaproteobacteria bacterium]|nr:hypothetical protein [Deltaproteobacteria bacterium]